MSLLNVLSLLGGLAFFLFGMNTMGAALEKCAGSSLKSILGKLTSSKFKGFLLGLVVTAVIQSSSATTVMVVGFVNSGLMQLSQAVGVIMGANLGTSVTAWLISMTGIEGDSLLMTMLKPSSFTPLLAFIGVILYMFVKNTKRKDMGLIFLGFAVLMFGMDTMSAAVKPLAEIEAFQNALIIFSNPILGVIMGAVVTAAIQSSSASVGILQALSLTGSISYATAFPIILGQNIGTCVSALISAMGASKNAKRTAFIHFYFNLLSTIIILPIFWAVSRFGNIALLEEAVDPLGIAMLHTGFNLSAVLVMTPLTRVLEKLACITVRDSGSDKKFSLLDERLFSTPAVAIAQSRNVTAEMAKLSRDTLVDAMKCLTDYDEKTAASVREGESNADQYEDSIGDYLVKLSNCNLSDADNRELSMQLHLIGDLERLSDHALNILESAEELKEKKMSFSGQAKKELQNAICAVTEIVDLAVDAFVNGDMKSAALVEPLEQVIDELTILLRNGHIERLRKNECTIEQGFVFNDLVTNLERVADHCSNIAVCVIETAHDRFDMHEYIQEQKESGAFDKNYHAFHEKYAV